MRMSRVHIMMAVYNGEKYIRDQIDSIISQTYSDWTLYISDDKSTDGTLAIISEYCNNYPDKIQIINFDRIGGAKKNFIYLYNNCPQAELYMFSDQDDIWLPDKIAKMVDAYDAASKENTLVYSELRVVDAELNTLSETFINDLHYSLKKEFMLMNNYIPGCVMMIDDKMKSSVGAIPDECIMHDWWIAMYATYFGNIISVNEKLHLYRQHGKNAIGAEQEQLNKAGEELAVKKLKKRKKQNNKFLKEYRSSMKEDEIKVFNRFNRMCNKIHSIKAVGIFWYHFRTNRYADNRIFSKIIYEKKI